MARTIPMMLFSLLITAVLATSAQATAIVYDNGIGVEASLTSAPLTLNTQLNYSQLSLGNSGANLSLGYGDTLSTNSLAQIVNGSSAGVYSAPYATSGSVTSNYLAVEAGGVATVTLNGFANSLGFLWGSVNSAAGYDVVKLENVTASGTSVIGTIDGSNLYSYLAASGLAGNLGSGGAGGSAYVDLISPTAFNTVVFESPLANAFETTSLQVNTVSVSEPATLSLMLALLMVIFFKSRQSVGFWQAPGGHKQAS